MSLGSQHRPLREVVADEIVERIRRGDLQPGMRLLEDKLASELGVSRNPVRESIRALEATGLIEVVPRRGAYVADVDPDDLVKLLELRSAIEAYAAEMAAERHTEADLTELDRCIDEGSKASANGDLVTAAECHRDFHLAIERASGNPYLGATVGPLRQRTELAFSMLSEHRGHMSWEEHRRIRDAIASGDRAAASARATDHVTSVITDLQRNDPPEA